MDISDEDFIKTRKTLMIISFLAIVYVAGGMSLDKLSILGTKIDMGHSATVNWIFFSLILYYLISFSFRGMYYYQSNRANELLSELGSARKNLQKVDVTKLTRGSDKYKQISEELSITKSNLAIAKKLRDFVELYFPYILSITSLVFVIIDLCK